MLQTFTESLNLSADTAETLLNYSLDQFLNAPEVNQLLNTLDTALLQETLPTAGGVLAEYLPPFYHWLKTELGLQRVPDSPDHATTWVVKFLGNQESLTRLIEMHRSIPRIALERSVPRLVGVFAAVESPSVRQEWQKAVAALCLVLVVAAREQECLVAQS